MNCQELRVGNLVYGYGLKHIFTITPNHILGIWEGDGSYEPIELTPEILKMCGFKKEHEWGILKFNPSMAIRFYEFNYAECDILQDYHFIGFKNSHIRYLHQLQNLFFSLTNVELDVSKMTN